MCGGSLSQSIGNAGVGGLSPRVRGKPGRRPGAPHLLGSIPACAGEARRPPSEGGKTKVYPRVCGGSESGTANEEITAGLSPRVRGKRLPGDVLRGAPRSIPACAGEAPMEGYRYGRYGVYPRVCGGSAGLINARGVVKGLSPRVRGKRGQMQDGTIEYRSIPACAGEAASLRLKIGMGRVYPRVCGGSLTGVIWQTQEMGLSPRVRGKPRAVG